MSRHQGLDNRLIKPSADVIDIDRLVPRRLRLGGVARLRFPAAGVPLDSVP